MIFYGYFSTFHAYNMWWIWVHETRVSGFGSFGLSEDYFFVFPKNISLFDDFLEVEYTKCTVKFQNIIKYGINTFGGKINKKSFLKLHFLGGILGTHNPSSRYQQPSLITCWGLIFPGFWASYGIHTLQRNVAKVGFKFYAK